MLNPAKMCIADPGTKDALSAVYIEYEIASNHIKYKDGR
jgi:hypothetical protein